MGFGTQTGVNPASGMTAAAGLISGGASGLEGAILARARERAFGSVSSTLPYLNHFGTSALHSTATAGSGVANFTAPDPTGGVINMQTSAVAGSFVQVNNAGSFPLVLTPNTRRWYMETRGKINTAVDANTGIWCCGLNGSTEAIGFGMICNLSADLVNFCLILQAGATTVVTSSTPFDTTTQHVFGMAFDATSVKAYLDSTLVCQTSTLTNLTAQSVLPMWFLRNGATAANRQLLGDYQALVTELAP